MPRYTVNGHRFTAERCVDGVLINPYQPKNFDFTPNENRPLSQAKWWHVPYIVTETVEQLDAIYAGRTDEHANAGRDHWIEGRAVWMKSWPSGTRYDVRCLNGGAWDRSSGVGMFATIEEAVDCANAYAGRRPALPSKPLIN